MHRETPLLRAIRRGEQMTVVRAVRSGLVNMIPVLIIGAFALILRDLPVKFYQNFIGAFAGGFRYNLFDFINTERGGVDEIKQVV